MLSAQRNGGRHCCQPPLRRAKDMPVFVTWSAENPKAPMKPALDPGSPAQASLPIQQLPPRRSRSGLPDCAARGFAGPSPDPASLLEPKSFEAKTVRRSAALLGSITLASRFAHLPHKEVGSRVALEEDRLFRRLFPADPEKNPKALSIACRRRSDLWSPAALFCPCGPSEEAGTAVPIT